MNLSVRLRLTLFVAGLVALVAIGGALVAPGVVERALVDEVVQSELDALEGFFTIEFKDDFVDEVFGPADDGASDTAFVFADVDEAEFVFDSLLQAGLFDDLLRVSATDDLVLGAGGDEFFRFDPDGSITLFTSPPQEVGQPIVSLFDLAAVAFGAGDDVVVRPDGEIVEFGVSDTRVIFERAEVDGLDVIVTAAAGGIDGTVSRVRTALWVALPLLVAVAALVTWWLAGRALRPVRAITERTETISGGTLHERVPVPASGDEIERLAATINGMLDRLEADDRRRKRFVSDASHELRSPVAVLRSEAEVALGSPDSTDVRALAGGMLDESVRMSTIIDDLLALARHDEGMPPPAGVIDLDDIVLAEVERTRRVPIDASAVSAGRVFGRADEFARAVSHLLDNAARHATSRATVALTTANGRVRLAVDDDGAGVPPDDRETIFERFARLDAARSRDRGGAGLGLAVVAGVVQRSGGSVHVEDSTLGGARFVVDLPAAD